MIMFDTIKSRNEQLVDFRCLARCSFALNQKKERQIYQKSLCA